MSSVDIRRIDVSYRQGWLSEPVERAGPDQVRQATWRCDPLQAGPGGCLGDIATHAAHLACFLSGQEITAVAAELSTAVSGRAVDDNVSALMRFSGGANGTLASSQICAGVGNDLGVTIGGSKGSLRWSQEEPNQLHYFLAMGAVEP